MGIHRGTQMTDVARGGTLHEHLADEVEAFVDVIRASATTPRADVQRAQVER